MDIVDELIPLVEEVISKFDPKPLRVNDNFPLRWESNIFIEDYDFSENFLELNKKEECAQGTFLKSVGTAIEIDRTENGGFEFRDGAFIIESHSWCSKLNTSKDFPSFGLVDKKFKNRKQLMEFIIRWGR